MTRSSRKPRDAPTPLAFAPSGAEPIHASRGRLLPQMCAVVPGQRRVGARAVDDYEGGGSVSPSSTPTNLSQSFQRRTTSITYTHCQRPPPRRIRSSKADVTRITVPSRARNRLGLKLAYLPSSRPASVLILACLSFLRGQPHQAARTEAPFYISCSRETR